MYSLDCNGKRVSLGAPVVMGVLNVTPDSFSDGGRFADFEPAIARAAEMAREGAAIIDIGGESTRPGAADVSEEEELRRVLPVVEALAKRLDVPLSVDTSKPAVMRAAVAAGAGLINDVRALREPGALEAAVECSVPVCLMHMKGEPRTMQAAPEYGDVVEEVCAFLAARVEACVRAGLPREHIVVDPGFGFGKTLAHNLALLAALDRIVDLGVPVLVGLSRKSMIGHVTGRSVEAREAGSLAAATLAAWQGAHIIRAHDVSGTVDALAIVQALRNGRS
jgi:dihydropteroate synthase